MALVVNISSNEYNFIILIKEVHEIIIGKEFRNAWFNRMMAASLATVLITILALFLFPCNNPE